MENETKKKREKHPDRIGLTPDCIGKVDGLINNLEEQIRGVKLSRAEIVNAIVLFHSPQFSEEEIELLRKQHFDEVKYAQWALRQMKAAKSRGENVSLTQFFGNIPK